MPDCATAVPDRPAEPRLLPMAGLTHGRRSPITCHLRCGDACAFGAPNATERSYFREVAAQALSRRGVVGVGAAAAGRGTATDTATRCGSSRSPRSPRPSTT